MHFTYQAPDLAELYQGDVLERTDALNAILQAVHPHFFQKDKNLYFMVLTQSCDLVRRTAGGGCKAPYIAIAPVRSLDTVLAREIGKLQITVNSEVPVLTDKAKAKLSEFLTRLYNNNEPGYFYLESEGTPLVEDCCAFLGLSVAVKADQHYQTCLDAKRVQLAEAFQAKLGWLVAQMYSRVGTTDWDPRKVSEKVGRNLKDAVVTIPADKEKAVLAGYADRQAGNADVTLASADVRAILNSVPTRKQLVIERTAAVMEQAFSGRPDADGLKNTVLKRLDNDSVLKGILG